MLPAIRAGWRFFSSCISATAKSSPRRHRQGRAAGPPATVLLALLSAGCATEPRGRCTMVEQAVMPVVNNRRQPIVQATIDGRTVLFMVDTGARFSILSPQLVTELGLWPDENRKTRLLGAGGMIQAAPVEVRDMVIGGRHARHAEFLVAGGNIHVNDGRMFGGIFGGDFLASYDVDFDLPNKRIALYSEQNCGNHLDIGWPDPVYEMPFSLEHDTAIRVTMKANDHAFGAILDSGASGTILDLAAAQAAGVPASATAADRHFTSEGIDENQTRTVLHRFASMSIGAERRSPYPMAIGDIESGPLLGADFFRTHRIWVSYAHELLWIHPVGHVHQVEPAPAVVPIDPLHPLAAAAPVARDGR
ncbi:retroviral-like aspartic protease family protein [Rhizosaccharibacter radicis]|uniref:Retroviral-like aspartic protease family protein n=1 Tax=Rhizosaccharibacter radicis TaxID=2782605 RepID=A0ABT1VZ39_9PROT|nr:retroviral-like aspartic protease family protein [Acetobacteraceae bacterium KSS12]